MGSYTTYTREPVSPHTKVSEVHLPLLSPLSGTRRDCPASRPWPQRIHEGRGDLPARVWGGRAERVAAVVAARSTEPLVWLDVAGAADYLAFEEPHLRACTEARDSIREGRFRAHYSGPKSSTSLSVAGERHAPERLPPGCHPPRSRSRSGFVARPEKVEWRAHEPRSAASEKRERQSANLRQTPPAPPGHKRTLKAGYPATGRRSRSPRPPRRYATRSPSRVRARAERRPARADEAAIEVRPRTCARAARERLSRRHWLPRRAHGGREARRTLPRTGAPHLGAAARRARDNPDKSRSARARPRAAGRPRPIMSEPAGDDVLGTPHYGRRAAAGHPARR